MPGDPPAIDPSELTFLATDARTPYVGDFPGEDGSKTAHYPHARRDSPGPALDAAAGEGRQSFGD
ncbi:MAG TPA: hypothetical protein VM487_00810 [Phycisphaerae bacterium]|nr:hypothetical protein [Phycisphaerae bacterium]